MSMFFGCCCEDVKPWFDLLLFNPVSAVFMGNRLGYFGAPTACWAGVRRHVPSRTIVPFGLTSDGLNLPASELALGRLSTVTGSQYNSWSNGDPPLRFNLQDALEELVNHPTAYIDGAGHAYAWVDALLDRDGAGVFAILGSEAIPPFGRVYKRQAWCYLSTSRDVTFKVLTATPEEFNAWEAAGNNTNRPDRPLLVMDLSGGTSNPLFVWSQSEIAAYAGDGTVTLFNDTETRYEQRVVNATRRVTYAPGSVDRYDIPGMALYGIRRQFEPAGSPGFEFPQINTSIELITKEANTGPSSDTAYTTLEGWMFPFASTDWTSEVPTGMAVLSSLRVRSPYHPKALVEVFSQDIIVPTTSHFATVDGGSGGRNLAAVILTKTECGFGNRVSPAASGEIATTLNTIISNVVFDTYGDAGNTPGDGTPLNPPRYSIFLATPPRITRVNKLNGDVVGTDPRNDRNYALAPTFYAATDATNVAIYSKGGLKNVTVEIEEGVFRVEYDEVWEIPPVDYPVIDHLTYTYEYESSPWYLRFNDDELPLNSDFFGFPSGPDNLFHLPDFGSFPTGGKEIFAIDVEIEGSHPIRRLDMSKVALPGKNVRYQYWFSDKSLYVFPGEPETGEARVALIYPWSGVGYRGADLLFMSTPSTVLSVLRVAANPNSSIAPITVHALTDQGIYFGNVFAFRSGKGVVPTSAPEQGDFDWNRNALHPTVLSNVRSANFLTNRYTSEQGQTHIDLSYATDTAAQFIQATIV